MGIEKDPLPRHDKGKGTAAMAVLLPHEDDRQIRRFQPRIPPNSIMSLFKLWKLLLSPEVAVSNKSSPHLSQNLPKDGFQKTNCGFSNPRKHYALGRSQMLRIFLIPGGNQRRSPRPHCRNSLVNLKNAPRWCWWHFGTFFQSLFVRGAKLLLREIEMKVKA